jgi:hypothetical protein
MMNRCLRLCRSHPILVAAFLGAGIGLANAIWIEIGGAANRTSEGVLRLFWASSSHASQLNPVQTATLLFIEFAGNVIAFALLFAIPVALMVGIRRILPGKRAESKVRQAEQDDLANRT